MDYVEIIKEVERDYPKRPDCHTERQVQDVAELRGEAASCNAHSTEPVLASPPVLPGWLVVYRDRNGRLRGGFDEPEHGTVAAADQEPQGWMFLLTDGTKLPMTAIRGVAETDSKGCVLSAWQVRECGLDGKQ